MATAVLGDKLISLKIARQRFALIDNMYADLDCAIFGQDVTEKFHVQREREYNVEQSEQRQLVKLSDLELRLLLTESQAEWLFADGPLPSDTQTQTELLAAAEHLQERHHRTVKALLATIDASSDAGPSYCHKLRTFWLAMSSGISVNVTRWASIFTQECLFHAVNRDLSSALDAEALWLLPPPDNSKWCVAGGIVLNALLGERRAQSDIDVFVLNNVNAVNELLSYYRDQAHQHGLAATVRWSGRVISLLFLGLPPVQIILSYHKTVFDLVLGFDVAPARCFWSPAGNCIAATPQCLASAESRVIRDYDNNLRDSRIVKFQSRGFTFEPRLAQRATPIDTEHDIPVVEPDLGTFVFRDPDVPIISYMNDRSEQVVRACDLSVGQIDLFRAAQIRLFGGAPNSGSYALCFDNRILGFQIVEHVLQCPKRVWGAKIELMSLPLQTVSPSRAADTRILLQMLRDAELRRTQDVDSAQFVTCIKNRDYSNWDGGSEYVLKCYVSENTVYCDKYGNRIADVRTRASPTSGHYVFGKEYAERRVLCHILMIGIGDDWGDRVSFRHQQILHPGPNADKLGVALVVERITFL